MTRGRLSVALVVLVLLSGCSVPDESPDAESPPPQTITLRVTVSDETEQRSPTGQTEVWLRGEGSWFPDMAFGGDVRDYSGLAVGSSQEAVFYPFGRDDPEILIDVPITAALCPNGCARDTLILEIWDDRFEVWAPGVDMRSIPRPLMGQVTGGGGSDSLTASEVETLFRTHKVDGNVAAALKKRSLGTVAYLATIHGYPNNVSVCEELIEPYNKDAAMSVVGGDYYCEELR